MEALNSRISLTSCLSDPLSQSPSAKIQCMLWPLLACWLALRAAVFRMRCNWSVAAAAVAGAGAHVDVHRTFPARFDSPFWQKCFCCCSGPCCCCCFYSIAAAAVGLLHGKSHNSREQNSRFAEAVKYLHVVDSECMFQNRIFMLFGPLSETDSLWRMRRNTKLKSTFKF